MPRALQLGYVTVVRVRKALVVLALVTLGGLPSLAAEETAQSGAKTFLHKQWQIQSSCEKAGTGERISTSGFEAKGWHKTDIPATVVGVLVTDKTYPDPNYGTNLKSFPGMHESNKTFFANFDMPAGSPFHCSWWYRTEFEIPAGGDKKTSWLNFMGINYRANIWLNGKKIADAKQVAGTYRTYEFNVTKYLHGGKANALAVEVFAPQKNDLGITWVDWNPTPPDKNMGIWKEVFLTQSADVSLRNPFVASKLDAGYQTAELNISVDLQNASKQGVDGVLRAEIGDVKVSQPVRLAGGEAKTLHFTPEKFAELKFAHPRLWWPYTMGEPNLYTARLSFEIGNQVSDSANVAFGIREVTSELTARGHRLFKINGRNVLIRGAAWAPDLLFRWSPSRLDADLAYVKDMGLNTIRLEGRLDREEFYEKTDRLGILVMPGWTCCDAWELWENWKSEQHAIAAASLKSQIRILRKHPSVFVWLNGSDGPPPAAVEKTYLAILKELEWPNPSVSSAAATATTVTGDSGVKMTGPYEYVPPVYWLMDTEAGGAYGYNTETSPGPAIPTRQSLARFIPKEHLWPIDDVWNYHAGGERFTTVNVFTDGLNRRYGQATSLDDYERKAQAVTYDGQRAMFEAYARNKYTSTGVIQWMLNNAWPSLIWHLYDYYLVPAGGYFGTKKACQPIHVQYSYDDHSVAVVNSTYEALKGIRVSAKIYNLDAKEKGAKEATLDFTPDSSTKAFDLPRLDDLTKTYFLRLELHDRVGRLVSDNFYWLSTKADVLDWKAKQDTVYTPQAEFGDLTGLSALPQVKLESSASGARNAEEGKTRVSVKNPGTSVAFMVHLRLTRGAGGVDVVPVLWEDNYFSLLPGEQREVAVSYALSALGDHEAVVEVEGFNVTPSRAAFGQGPAGK
ncbi:MAG TPA: beta galactosidase jelly roll domain-containing protein [Candidatus Dormibacteraeota bacterium]|nr:beta galactosidase jelly roll domain-containing protein [Candidatus Dormibacteraeota bacterium]